MRYILPSGRCHAALYRGVPRTFSLGPGGARATRVQKQICTKMKGLFGTSPALNRLLIIKYVLTSGVGIIMITIQHKLPEEYIPNVAVNCKQCSVAQFII